MLFIHTIDKVLSGEKVQTRRIVKAGEFACNQIGRTIADLDAWHDEFSSLLTGEYVSSYARIAVKDASSRDVYVIGKTYAAQPARGKPAVARIRITDIRREDVRNISFEDAVAEGFGSQLSFLYTWVNMHDKVAYKNYWEGELEIFEYLATRPAERYDAWALTFELVQA